MPRSLSKQALLKLKNKNKAQIHHQHFFSDFKLLTQVGTYLFCNVISIFTRTPILTIIWEIPQIKIFLITMELPYVLLLFFHFPDNQILEFHGIAGFFPSKQSYVKFKDGLSPILSPILSTLHYLISYLKICLEHPKSIFYFSAISIYIQNFIG